MWLLKTKEEHPEVHCPDSGRLLKEPNGFSYMIYTCNR